ncbi:MAG TPA: hypothetical protein VIP10_00595, partial [Burkholderiaceae bacterium]
MDSSNDTQGDLALIEHALCWTDGFSGWPPRTLRQLAIGSRLARHPRKALVASDTQPQGQTL